MFNYHYKLYMIIPLLKFFRQFRADFCLLLFLAKRYDEVKNKVCVSFTLNHSKVVEGVFAVVLIDYFGGHCLVFVNLIVVNNNGVHMYAHNYAKVLVNFLFNIVYYIMKRHNVHVGRHLCVTACDYSARALVVHDKVVITYSAVGLGQYCFNIVNKLLCGLRT